jgi:hypothetical protein
LIILVSSSLASLVDQFGGFGFLLMLHFIDRRGLSGGSHQSTVQMISEAHLFTDG